MNTIKSTVEFTDTEDQRPVVDFNEVLRQSFENSKGVVQLQANMPDAILLFTIKHALSFGKPFVVVPSSNSSDGIQSSVESAESGVYIPGMDEQTAYPSQTDLCFYDLTESPNKK